MKAIVTVIGKDRTGIIAAVSAKLNDWNVNIEDISQTIMNENFVMVMVVNCEKSTIPFDALDGALQDAMKAFGVIVRVNHEDIFNCMQRV